MRADGAALTFYVDNERLGAPPTASLTRAILRGEVKLRANLLGKLGDHGIGVIVLSRRKGKDHNRPQLLHRRLKGRALPIQFSVFFFCGNPHTLECNLRDLACMINEMENDLRRCPLPYNGSCQHIDVSVLPSGIIHSDLLEWPAATML